MGRLWHAALHPVIRIAIFIILAGALSMGNVNILLMAALAVAAAYGITANTPFFAANTPLFTALNMLRRMRWLFLSLFIIYCWFTPGTPLPLALPASILAWLPTLQGLEEASIRIASLVTIVLAVHLLLHITSREQLLGAIYWWLKPLSYAGIPYERLAIRIALVLETVPKVQPLIHQALAEHRQTDPGAPGAILAHTGQVAAALYQNVLTHAEQQACHSIEIPAVISPPVWQWLFPMGMAVVLGWAGL